ncbi:MAG: FHA domain-containing protein [Nevskiales bacterium]|nr:FHA domain-containing protein [Nevskiales bacterium]
MWTVVVRDPGGQVIAQHPLHQKTLTIGRDQTRDIILPAKQVSRTHARLELKNGQPVVVDTGSANGTLVNGARITAPTNVDESSKIEIGDYRVSLKKAGNFDANETLVATRRFAPPPASATAATAATATTAKPMPKAVEVPAARSQTPKPPPATPSLPAQGAGPSQTRVPASPKGGGDLPEPRLPSESLESGSQDDGTITSDLERRIQSIRAFRAESQKTDHTKREHLEGGWAKLVADMRLLQGRLSGDKRVLDFSISRDQKEIVLKLADRHEKRGYRYFLLSQHHPEGKFPGVEKVWLREFGHEDASFEDPQKAMEALLVRIAGALA